MAKSGRLIRPNFRSGLKTLGAFWILGIVTGCSTSKIQTKSENLAHQDVVKICAQARDNTDLGTVSTSKVLGLVYEDFFGNRSVENSLPLEGVLVVVFHETLSNSNNLYYSISDQQGRFELEKSLAPGRYRLKTCLEGWNSVELDLEIEPSEEVEELHLFIGLS